MRYGGARQGPVWSGRVTHGTEELIFQCGLVRFGPVGLRQVAQGQVGCGLVRFGTEELIFQQGEAG